ncbi:MAG: thermonuclease family protein [Armatimonadota bacterium]
MLFLCVLPFCCSPAPCAPRPYAATVLRILDGDTIEVQRGQTIEHVRLFGIDCPEKSQEFGSEATKATSELALNKQVAVEPVSKDRDNRVVAVVILPGRINLNQKLVAMGMAWWWKEYAPKSTVLPRNEASAKSAKLGLWAKSEPIPPWEFRAQHRGKSIDEPTEQPKKQAVVGSVYIAKSGHCYHRRDCRTIRDSKVTSISRAEATKNGYRACEVCKP